MRRILSIVLVLSMILALAPTGLFAITASAETTSGYYTYTVSNGEATITDCDTSISGDITIPSELDGYPVTSIGPYAFQYCARITSIAIPKGVTIIGFRAFLSCTSVTSITIPDSVTSIAAYAFEDCTRLAGIWVDENNIHYRSDDGKVLFNKNKTVLIQALRKLSGEYEIPRGVISIGEGAFSGCYGLNSIIIPDSVTNIGDCAFSGCSGLTSITIPDSVTNIGECAFSGCSGLTSVTIPSSVISIGNRAFQDCKKLNSVHISDIAAWCMIDFEYLWNASANPLYYAGELYLNGELVTDLVVPDSVTRIGPLAFYHYGNLTSITIPNSVTSIGSYSFYGCNSLTSITIPDSVTSIGSYAFYSCNSLTNVTIGNNVTSIGSYSFYNCDGLTSITIPDSVTSIGSYAFYGCNGLTNVTIGNNVASIGSYSFYNCDGLTSITIPDSVTNIDSYTFYGCTSLTSVNVGKGVTSIGYRAFYGCASLFDITISDSITNIEDQAFYDCSIKKMIIAEGSKSIKSNMVIGYKTLQEVVIPDSVTSIGTHAFLSCINLTSVTIGNSVTSIGDKAFSFCRGLTSITIPKSVTSIGEDAFEECAGLTNVWYQGSLLDRQNIQIAPLGSYNKCLKNATWHYNTCADTHTYLVDCAIVCQNCEWVRISDVSHAYTNDCDTVCNLCGSTRNVPHNYEWVIDQNETCGKNGIKHEECTLCHLIQSADTVISATGHHIYENAYDAECDVCGYFRTIYTITYDLNKGTGVFEPLPKEHGVDIALPTGQPAREGYHFAGWSTTKNGDVEYDAGGICSLNQSVILYAQWNLHCTSCYGSGTVEQNISCTNCGGDGKWYSSCGTCSGAGYVGYVTEKNYCFSCSGNGQITDYTICSRCNGNRCSACGYDGFSYGPVTKACSKCGGSGQISTQVPLRCIDCGGDGDREVNTCGVCDGDGKKIVHKTCTHCNRTGNYNRVSVSAPNAPVVDNKTATSIALKAIENGEYSIDGINWQESPIFENLETGKEYSFYQRYAKTDTTYTSEISIALVAIPEQLYIPGDLTGDDKINSLDGLLLMRYLNGWNVNVASPEAMDVNSDGKVNSLDGLILMRYLNGWNVNLG